jgi:hypothetical protein
MTSTIIQTEDMAQPRRHTHMYLYTSLHYYQNLLALLPKLAGKVKADETHLLNTSTIDSRHSQRL